MKKIIAVFLILVIAGAFLIAIPAQANETVQTIINTIKTRGQTSTPTPTASTAVRG